MNNRLDVAGLFPELKLFRDMSFAGPVIKAWELAIARGNFPIRRNAIFCPEK